MTDAEIVQELVAAAEGRMQAMYDSDSEASWRKETDRWHAACSAATGRWGRPGDASAAAGRVLLLASADGMSDVMPDAAVMGLLRDTISRGGVSWIVVGRDTVAAIVRPEDVPAEHMRPGE